MLRRKYFLPNLMTYMISYWKHILKIAFAACALESCIMTTTVEEINETVERNGSYINSKSNEISKGQFSILLKNNANNTCLQIDSIQICNIHVADSATNTIVKGNKTLHIHSQLEFGELACTSTETLPVQTITPWTPKTLPQNSNNTYGKICGKIYTYLTDGTPVLLTPGPLYFPLQGKITSNTLTTTEFEITDNCPLYYELDGKMEEALKTINFDVTVDDWQEP